MDKRVYLLAIIAFIVGMVELILGGILDLVANDLNVTLGQAGLLISIFSLVWAVFAPILLIATASVERKRLTLIALFVFLIGNIITVLSPNYAILFIARIISAASGSLLGVLSLVLASSIVPKRYIGRAIGLVVTGISGSIVLGIPIGLVIGNAFGWRAPFVLTALLTLTLMVAVYFVMAPIKAAPPVPLKQQLATLKRSKVFFAQMTTFLFISGHITLYAYFTPFLKTAVGLSPNWVSVVYFIFGAAAVAGGAIGGAFTDRFGSRRVLLYTVSLFSICMFIVPYTIHYLPLFISIVIIYGLLNFMITPPIQSYLVEVAPATAAVQQSLNNSALHLGIAFGSLIGSIIIERANVVHNSTVGSIIVLLSLGAIIYSITKKDDGEKLLLTDSISK